MKLVKANPLIGKIESGAGNGFGQFWRRVPFTRLLLLAAALAAPRAFALNPAEQPADYIASHWDAEDGLPHNSIKQIFQTRDGYLWVGTLQGLARFDGLTFTIFTSHNTPGLPNSQITSFAETPDGSLWIGTSFGLARYQNGRFTAYGQADGVKSKSGTINAVCVAPDGSLWIASQDGITRWVDGKFVNDIDTSAYSMIGLRSLFVDRQKAMWLAAGSVALRYQDGKFTRFGPAQGLPAQRLEMLCEDAQGRIIAVTQNGLLRLEGERFVPFEQNGALSSPRAGAALVDRAGNLWIGSAGGLDRCSGGKVVPYVDHNGNKLGTVDALFEDREGCLWVGMSAGLYRLTDRRAYTLPMKAGVGGLALAVTQTRDGAVWVSSWDDGVNRLQDGAFTHYAPRAPLSPEPVTLIYQAPDGTMWLGNRGSSLDWLKGNKVTTFVYTNGVPTSRPVTAMLADDYGTLLLGISKRGLLRLRDGQIEPVPEAAEFAPETVWMLQRTRDGRLLMGTSKGLYERHADRTWQLVTLRGVPQPVIVRALLEETNGTIWLATEDQGLIRWQNGEARAYNSRAGMVDDTLYSVLDDNLGSLWVSSARGIARIRKSEFAELDRGSIPSLNCLTFGRADGLLSASSLGSGSPAAIRLADGRLMMATDQGVAVIDPHLLQVNSQPPTVMIESVVADDQPLPPGPAVSIPAGVNRLEIRYNALSLIAPQRLRFRYQLEGYDPGWVEAGHERTAHYTQLDPGRYTFRVMACNNDGVWSETGATLALTMLPQFYQTLWFRLAAIALLAAALASLVSLRLRQMNRRQKTLERMNAELDQRVRERTADLAKTNEVLQNENAERKQAEEALHRSQEEFKDLFDNAPVGFHEMDAGGRLVRINNTELKMLGYSAEELLGQFIWKISAEEETTRRTVLAKLGGEMAPLQGFERMFRRKDGSPFPVLINDQILKRKDGVITGIRGGIQDITERKLAEEAVRESQALYHSLVEQLPANVYRKDAEGRFIFVNSRFCKSKGKTADEILGQTVSAVNSKEETDQVIKEHELIMRAGKSIEKEEFYAQPDGTVQYLQVLKSPVLDADGKIIGTQGIQFDITQRKQAEESLRESQALYHSLVDQIPAAIFRKDAEGRYVFVNASFCRIMEMAADQILGKTSSELVACMKVTQATRRPVSDKLGTQGISHHESIMRTGRQIIVEDEYQGSDGKRSFYHTVKSAIFGADGQIMGSQGMLFDITDRKQAEAELANERDLLRALLDYAPDQIYFKDAQSRFLKASKSHAEKFGVRGEDALVGKTDFDFFTEEHARSAFEDEQEIIRTGHPLIGKMEKENWKDGRVTWVLTNKMARRNPAGEIIGTLGISKDITAIKQTEAKLAYERDLLRALLDSSPDSIFFKDTQSHLVRASKSEVANLMKVALSRHRAAHPGNSADQLPAHLASLERFREYVIGKTDADSYGSERAGSFNQDEQEIIRTGRPMLGKIERTVGPDGSTLWNMTTKVPWRNKDGEIIGTFGTSRDISDLKNAEAKIEETYKQLLATSRQAGMAEIATNVLHNIGNVLNSVNVSASLVVDNVKKCKIANLAKVAAMLREHEHDLGTFITSDAKGRQLPVYLGQLSEQLLADQETAVRELDLLVKNIEHIKDVVSMQQNYARVSGVKEIINVRDLVEDGLRMNADALARHRVEVIREFGDVPPINVDKHRVLQILVNLIRNAKYACDESGRADRRLTVRVADGDGRIKITVADNGIGIPPENLTRIFNHGFTTRKDGHGFGLHSGALAAKEMGGALAVQSDGPGKGATFTLELPQIAPASDTTFKRRPKLEPAQLTQENSHE